MSDSLLGQREGPRLEFKSRSVLGDLTRDRVGRAVVAFLNSDGGDLYIGVRDDGDVAVAIEHIDDAEVQRRRVYDHLVDTIEPAIDPDEIQISVIEQGHHRILCVRCAPKEDKKPYAFVANQGRWFAKRLDARVCTMTRHEIGVAFRSAAGADEEMVRLEDEALDRLGKLRTEVAKRRVFWIALEPHSDQRLQILDRRVAEFCTRPALTEQRSNGWNVVNSYAKAKPSMGKELLVGEPEEYTFLRVFKRGAMSFEAPNERLFWKGPERHIWPLAISEFPVSFFRLAKALIGGAEGRVVCQAAIFGARGWHLVGGGIGNMHWLPIRPETEPYPDDDLITDPLSLTLDSIRDEPDWCGYRLVSMIYAAFNLGEDAMIPEFDRELRRLVLPG